MTKSDQYHVENSDETDHEQYVGELERSVDH